jgi:hypothetical protein
VGYYPDTDKPPKEYASKKEWAVFIPLLILFYFGVYLMLAVVCGWWVPW